MARNQAKLRLGYFPLPLREAARIRKLYRFSGPTSVLDPCAGTGAAIAAIAAEAPSKLYAIELDAQRAQHARSVADEVIHGSAFDTSAPVESFGLIYLNPPYDFEIGEGANQRLERVFLDHVWRWLKPGGILIVIIPMDRVRDCRSVLSVQFRDKAIYRLTEPESVQYRQVAVFGVRRTRLERDKLTDWAVQQAALKLDEWTRRYEEIPPLPDEPDQRYVVPETGPAKLEYRGLPLDTIEDLLPLSAARIQAQRVTHAQRAALKGRPLTPLHKGHVGLLCTASALNGAFGCGADRHLSFWESVKVVDKVEEDTDQGRITRERERFAQRLTLLYADGKFALLSDKGAGGDHRHGERSPADGPAEVCPTEG